MSIVQGSTATTDRNYIYAGNEPVAIDERTSSSNTFYYLLTDHQGSISGITNSSGALVVGEAFHPYGRRENPATWQDPISASDLATIGGITARGYTFKDTLLYTNHSLVNLGGRVEDAFTGRFLSADPIIPHPEDPQSYNPYSYTRNNPLTYTDPSGFEDKTPCTGSLIEPCNSGAFNVLITGENGSSGAAGRGGKGGGNSASDSTGGFPLVCDSGTCWYELPGLDQNGNAPGACGTTFTCACTTTDCVAWDPSGPIGDISGSPTQIETPVSAGYGPTKAAPQQQSNPKESAPQGPSDPYTCAKTGMLCQPQTPPAPCLSGGAPSVNNNPNLPQNEKMGTLSGVVIGVVAGAVFAFTAPELDIFEAAHLAPYAAMSGGGAGGTVGFGFGAASTTATCPGTN